MIRRLRTLPDPAATYPEPHDHRRYGHGHWLRVEATKVALQWVVDNHGPEVGADLSCGNGELLKSMNLPTEYYGDFAQGYELQGPIEETLFLIPKVDVFILSETLEHLDDPRAVLSHIRGQSPLLVLTTPVGTVERGQDENLEHLWCWDIPGVEELLIAAGWWPQLFMSVDSRYLQEPYNYGIWVCT